MKRSLLTFISALLIFLCTCMAPAFALSINELEGKYLVTSKLVPVTSVINLDGEGNIDLVEQTGKFNCQGSSELILKKITAVVRCNNNATFKLIVNLNKVESFSSFTAPIKISIYDSQLGTENPWEFKKLND